MKAQVSFDLLLTAIGLMVLAGSFIILNDFLLITEQTKSVRAQERTIISNIVDVSTHSSVLAGGAIGSKVTFSIPKMFVAGQTQKQDCSISLNKAENSVSIATTIENQTTQEKRKVFFHPSLKYNDDNSTISCGHTLVIEKK